MHLHRVTVTKLKLLQINPFIFHILDSSGKEYSLTPKPKSKNKKSEGFSCKIIRCLENQFSVGKCNYGKIAFGASDYVGFFAQKSLCFQCFTFEVKILQRPCQIF